MISYQHAVFLFSFEEIVAFVLVRRLILFGRCLLLIVFSLVLCQIDLSIFVWYDFVADRNY